MRDARAVRVRTVGFRRDDWDNPTLNCRETPANESSRGLDDVSRNICSASRNSITASRAPLLRLLQLDPDRFQDHIGCCIGLGALARATVAQANPRPCWFPISLHSPEKRDSRQNLACRCATVHSLSVVAPLLLAWSSITVSIHFGIGAVGKEKLGFCA
ncbi:MAG: hypothetical protein IPK27_10945 [Rhodanobacteraceae bacterium]|nr:hypothetical protein [Rhodanobacteraceae bacterium]